MSVRKAITSAVAALTLGTAVATPGNAQAMTFGDFGLAALAGDVALGAAPRRAVIVEHRYVRKGNRLHYCGCVVRQVRFFP